jgi:hypothetical protein
MWNATNFYKFPIDIDAGLVGTLQQSRLELLSQETACLVIARDDLQIVLLIDEFPCPVVAVIRAHIESSLAKRSSGRDRNEAKGC